MVSQRHDQQLKGIMNRHDHFRKMPVHNIEDNRTNNKNVSVHVIFEPCCHDNGVENSTQFPVDETFQVHLIRRTTIDLAIRFAAQEWPRTPVTMYLYDEADATCCSDYLMETSGGKVMEISKKTE